MCAALRSVALLVDTPPASFPTTSSARWQSDNGPGVSEVSLEMDKEQFFVAVYAHASTNYTIAAYTHRTCDGV